MENRGLCESPGCKNLWNYKVQFPEGAIYRLCRKHVGDILALMSSHAIGEPYTVTILPATKEDRTIQEKVADEYNKNYPIKGLQ